MPKRKRSSRSSKRSKRRRTMRVTKRSIRSIVLRSAETKKLLYNDGTNYLDHNVNETYNLMYHMAAQGANQHQLIGNKIWIKGFKFRIVVDSRNLSGTPATAPIRCVFHVLKCKAYNTTTNVAGSDLYETTTLSSSPYLGIYDSNKAKVIKAKTVMLVPQFSGQGATKTVDMYVPINKTFTFKNFDSSYESKGWNYYLLVRLFQSGTASGTIGNINMNSICYFKDD